MKKSPLVLLIVMLMLLTCGAQAQIIKKPNLKNEGNKLLRSIGKKDEPAITDTETNEVRPTESGNKKLKPPDVNKNIEEAMKMYEAKSYGETRFAIEQAMMGVELEIGNEILETMPEKVDGIPFEESEDEVTSSGYGFAGLLIRRMYYGSDRSVEASVLNNSMALSNMQMMVSNPAMASYDDNEKIVTVQGNKSLLEYDEYSGFKLTTPLGQSTGFMLNCVNFESEEDVIAAADQFDLAKIKDLLGEK